jgi:RNA polymerase sigma factor (TIGR02999 family)
MNTLSSAEITQLLLSWQDGDKQAFHKLIPLLYSELHRIAARHMRQEKPGHTLQTTALLNEVYCKLTDQKMARWVNRAQFLSTASHLMRRILVDHARRRASLKGGGGVQKISLDENALTPQNNAPELISLDAALDRLAGFDARKSRIVEMKFFGGLTTEEIATIEKVSARTIEREWRKARAWLYDAIRS